jgi:hypothetical protein
MLPFDGFSDFAESACKHSASEKQRFRHVPSSEPFFSQALVHTEASKSKIVSTSRAKKNRCAVSTVCSNVSIS